MLKSAHARAHPCRKGPDATVSVRKPHQPGFISRAASRRQGTRRRRQRPGEATRKTSPSPKAIRPPKFHRPRSCFLPARSAGGDDDRERSGGGGVSATLGRFILAGVREGLSGSGLLAKALSICWRNLACAARRTTR